MRDFFKKVFVNTTDLSLQKDWLVLIYSVSYIGLILYAVIEWTRGIDNLSGLMSIVEAMSYQTSIIVAGVFGASMVQTFSQGRQQNVNFNPYQNQYQNYNGLNGMNNYNPYNNFNGLNNVNPINPVNPNVTPSQTSKPTI